MKLTRFSKMKNKILIYLIIIVIISIFTSGFIYKKISNQILIDSISRSNQQTIFYVKANIENIINSINAYSKLIISNGNIQQILHKDENKDNLILRQNMLLDLNILLENSPLISDIYIIDTEGNSFSAYTNRSKNIAENYYSSSVVKKAIEDNGSFSLHLNGEGFFIKDNSDYFISFSRAIKDLNTQEIIGVLVINIPSEYLLNSDNETLNDEDREIYIINKNGQSVLSEDYNKNFELYEFAKNRKDVYIAEKINLSGKDFFISSYWVEDFNYYIINTISLNYSSEESNSYKIGIIGIIIINLILIFIGVTLFKKKFVGPLDHMILKIKSNGDNLKEIQLKSNIYEFNQLEFEYNEMVVKNRNLIINKVAEQKYLRKKELELLQAQIKPHFLYNTLDTIKLLAIKGENEKVFQAVKSLGKFYQNSLGKGEETISIIDEVNIVINYVKIQNYRYKDILKLKTCVEAGLEDYKILRLILQPLVENALYHGIRPKGEKGIIDIKIFNENKLIKIIVEDDGIGFDTNTLEDNKLNGYGFKNTKERLMIFYENKANIKIESEKGIGTKVSIIIPEDEIMNPKF